MMMDDLSLYEIGWAVMYNMEVLLLQSVDFPLLRSERHTYIGSGHEILGIQTIGKPGGFVVEMVVSSALICPMVAVHKSLGCGEDVRVNN